MLTGELDMIFGIGTDIVEVERVQNAVVRNPKILDRLFTQAELSYFEKRNMKAQHIAGGFAAKEAILKALGTGLSGLSWKDVEVLRHGSGKPMVKLYGKAKEYAAGNNIGCVLISISHSQDYAMAMAVAELTEEIGEISLESHLIQ
jgi:holo-[acyl-carrier protein] synthase